MGAIRSVADIGPAIRALRERRGITSRELGRRAGFSQGYISMIETGIRVPHTPVLITILAALSAELSVVDSKAALVSALVEA